MAKAAAVKFHCSGRRNHASIFCGCLPGSRNPPEKIQLHIPFARGDTMDKDAMRQFDIPVDMRTMAEKSVEQARVAFNTFMAAAQEAVATLEGQAKATQAGAKDISEKALSYAERNVANTFAFADRIVHAKNAEEFIRLQTEFIQAQMKELAAQAKDLGESAAKMAMKSVPPKIKS
jgi:phasin